MTSNRHDASSAHRRDSSKKPPLKKARTNGTASSQHTTIARKTAGHRRAVEVRALGTDRTVDVAPATRVPVRAGSHPHPCCATRACRPRVPAGTAPAPGLVVVRHEDRPAHGPAP